MIHMLICPRCLESWDEEMPKHRCPAMAPVDPPYRPTGPVTRSDLWPGRTRRLPHDWRR